MLYNDSTNQFKNGDMEVKFINIITQFTNAGYASLITNDFSDWNFLHNFGVNLKDDYLDEPYRVLELQILSCLLNSKSFHYWNDEYPTETVQGIVMLAVKLCNENNICILNGTINMPVEFSIMCMKSNDYQWHFDSFISNNGCQFDKCIENIFDVKN